MHSENQPDQTSDQLKARLARVRHENGEIWAYVTEREKTGVISEAASKACFAASVKVMRDAGIIEPQLSGVGVGDQLLCVIVAQANHAAREAVLQIHPELRTDFNEKVPPESSFRSR